MWSTIALSWRKRTLILGDELSCQCNLSVLLKGSFVLCHVVLEPSVFFL